MFSSSLGRASKLCFDNASLRCEILRWNYCSKRPHTSEPSLPLNSPDSVRPCALYTTLIFLGGWLRSNNRYLRAVVVHHFSASTSRSYTNRRSMNSILVGCHSNTVTSWIWECNAVCNLTHAFATGALCHTYTYYLETHGRCSISMLPPLHMVACLTLKNPRPRAL